MSTQTSLCPAPRIVSPAEWLAARKQLLAKEKALTHQLDLLAAERRELPWLRVEKSYVFTTPAGPQTLAELFRGRSQLIVQHFMLGPGWDEGCVGCSLGGDEVDGIVVHLENHDVAFTAVSRAPLAEIERFQRRMGWRFRWVSSHGSDFNYDFQVSFTPADAARGRVFYNFAEREFICEELHGVSVFARDDAGLIYRTYSAYARGCEAGGLFALLDLTPKGRNENGPSGDLTDWLRHHDRYGQNDAVLPSGRVAPRVVEPAADARA